MPKQPDFFDLEDRYAELSKAGEPLEKLGDIVNFDAFRDHLTQANAVEKLFARFELLLQEKGYLARSGQILDASLIAAPRQHHTRAEKEAIKSGQNADDIWPDEPAKAAQKDVDTRWTVKFSAAKARADGSTPLDLAIPVFGYKNHISIDQRYGLIRRWDVSSAAVHDSQKFVSLLDRSNTARDVWADTAYRSKANETLLAEGGFVSRIHRKKARGKAMSVSTAKANNAKSRIRARVELVFAVQKGTMGLFIRSIGLARARTRIGLANLTYNMKRLIYLNARVTPT